MEEDERQLFNLNAIVYLLIIAVVVYGIIFLFNDLSDLQQSFSLISFQLLFILLALTLCNYFLRYLKWRMGTFKIKDWNVVNDMIIYFAGFLFSLTPSKVGEAARGILLHNKKSEVEVSYGVSLTVVDRLSDLIGISLLSVLMLFTVNNQDLIFLSISLLFGIIVVILLLLNNYTINLISRLLGKFSNKLASFPQDIYRDLQEYGIGKFVIAIVLSVISWSFEGIGFYLILNHLNIDITVSIAVFIFSLGTIIGAISFLPGGLGGAELSMIGFVLLLTSASNSIASAATLLIRVATLWFGIIFGLVNYFLYLQIQNSSLSV